MKNNKEVRQVIIPAPVRWDRTKGSEHAPDALHNILVITARFNTYDPIKLQGLSGYPLGWVASAVWVLLQVPSWTHHGHATLSALLAVEDIDQAAVDECIGWQMEQIWAHDSRDQLDLELEWFRHTGISIED